MSPSSIFNFESFAGFNPRLPLGLLAAAALVLCTELAVRLAPDTWLIPYYSRLGFRGFMEHEVLPRFENPRIAIVGTSRAADAIVPKTLDEALGLPEFSTVNLSIFGSRTSDWLDLYRRNRAKLSHLELLIVVVDEWSFSSGVGNDEQFCLDAPLSDRWNFVQTEENPDAARLDFLRLKRNRLLADWVFNMRLKLGFVPLAISRSLHLGQKREPVFDARHTVRSTSAETGREASDPRNYHERIRNFYKFFDTHPIYIRHIEELARMVREDGGRLALLHLPNRRSYQLEVEKLFPNAYAQHLRATAELASRTGAFYQAYRFPEELGLADDDYDDYCHLAVFGAETCTKSIAEWIKNKKLLAR